VAECIVELRREQLRVAEEIWHVARPGGDDQWRGIACSPDEGIAAPGHGVERDPTCPDCVALLAGEGAGSAR